MESTFDGGGSVEEFTQVVLDAEANGLFNWVRKEFPDTIHVVVLKDIHTGRILSFVPQAYLKDFPDCLSVENDFPKYLMKIDLMIGHNLVTYDRELFKKIYKYKFPLSNIEDTLILSQLSNPSREGGHGLGTWGKRFGRFKPDHDDWSQFSPAMLHRCKEDVEINFLLYAYLKKLLKNFDPKSIRLEHKVRELMYEQEKRGCPLDVIKANQLVVEIKEEANKLKKDILKDFKPKPKFIRNVELKWKKEKVWTGEYETNPITGRKRKVYEENKVLSKVGLGMFEDEEIEAGIIGGNFCTFKIEEFNLDSPSQIVERMNEAGWKPYILTKKGSPKVCEENLDTLPDTAPQSAKNFSRWKMLETRWKLFQSYLDNTDSDNNIHGSVNPLGTRTGRMAHSNPNLGNVPGKGAPYGKEARECFTVKDPDKEIMVGADASGIQLRALAHYVGSQSYIDMVTGPDIHAEHGIILEFLRRGENNPDVFEEGRGKAKTFIYSWLFGAGDMKLGLSLGGNRELGREKKELFYSRVEGLPEFMKRKTKEAERGYMRGLDGRLFIIPSDHLALPCYLQGFEQVIMKYAMVRYHNELNKLGIPFKQVLMVHDEFEVITRKEYGDIVGQTIVKSIKEAGEILGSRCPLDGEYKLGLNWYEVH